jgi:hypothetical protein
LASSRDFYQRPVSAAGLPVSRENRIWAPPEGLLQSARALPSFCLAQKNSNYDTLAAMDQAGGESEVAGACERTRRHAQEYLDGELEESVSSAIAVHIVVCNPCGNRITFEAAFLRTISRGAAAPRVALPTTLEQRVESLLKEWRRGDA